MESDFLTNGTMNNSLTNTLTALPEAHYIFQWLKPGNQGFLQLGQNSEEVKRLSAQEADMRDIRGCLRGDEEFYRRIVERYQARVSAMMWRFSRDERVHAELVQDVFVEIYLSLPKYRPKAPFSHWLSRIATRVGYGYWKKQARQKKQQVVSLQQWDQAVEPALGSLSSRQAAEILHGLLSQLPPRDRLVLTLRFLEEKDVQQTAELTGWSKAMVKVQTLRARRKLRKLFDDYIQG